jgi:glycosyltransferase involved in cell wall biosynthesis
VNDIAQKCLTILTDPGARDKNIDLGRENVKRFSWQESARKVIKIYNLLRK